MMFLLVAAFVAFVCAAPPGDKITALPGQPSVNFDQYAGYVDTNISPQRGLFYWFVERDHAPATAPLLIWLQGGPGCSSLMGLFTENGPWVVDPSGKTLSPRSTSWNKLANVLFIESPAGVGFSYDLSANVPTTGDNQTRFDLYDFMLQWTGPGMFPEYQKSAMYISGESYGGHYVPQLAWTIIEQNKRAARKLNLQGMLVGNPWTSDKYDGEAVLPWIYTHALASQHSFNEVNKACGFRAMPDVKRGARDFMHPRDFISSMRKQNLNAACQQAENKFMSEIGDKINQYDIYVDCQASQHKGLPCMNNDNIVDYLNSAPVKAALHVRSNLLTHTWNVCNDINYVSSWASVVPIYPTIIKELGHVMVYSGDVTYNCGETGSQNWINQELKMPIVSHWQNWLVDGQVGGYHTGYGHNNKTTFSFVTVREAGHMVPQYQPKRAFKMLDNFFEGVF